MKSKICVLCKKSFVPKSNVKNRLYCNKQCYFVARAEEVYLQKTVKLCTYCKKSFILKRGCKGVYCSIVCKGEHQKILLKGANGSFFGRKHTDESKAKLSKSLTGLMAGDKNPFYGRHHTEKTKRLLSEKKKGVPSKVRGTKRPNMCGENNPSKRTEVRKKISDKMLGREQPKLRGENCHLWKGGITSENEKARKSKTLVVWRKAVFERDRYICQKCGKHGGDLQAHHIVPFSVSKQLRTEVSNGQTLCKACHRQTDTYGNRIKTNVYMASILGN